MGDIADYLIEQGFDQLALHLAGQCGQDFCQYCEEELEKEKQEEQHGSC